MEHPGLDITTIKNELTLEEIQVKILDLNKRISFAYSTGNQPMLDQLNMMLEVYMRAQNELLDKMFGNNGGDHDEKIDIS